MESLIPAETWMDVPEYEGYYQVSDQGRVRSLDRVATSPKRSSQFMKGEIMTLKECKGYAIIALSKEGEQKWFRVNRLVKMTFHPISGMADLEVNHLDGNKKNNSLINLEWCTSSENKKHAYRIGIKQPSGPVGEESPVSKLKERDVVSIRRYLLQGKTLKEIGEMFGVSISAISGIKSGRTWKHVR